MHLFTDSNGRQWQLALNFATLEKLRDAGIDLTDPKTVTHLGDDPYQLGRLLWLLVEEQATPENISAEMFARAMASGEAIESAVSALLDELILFTRPARRPALEKALQARRKLEAATLRAVEEEIASGTLDRKIEAEIQKLREGWTSTD